MSSDNAGDQLKQAYKDDSRIPCQYGRKCYQKNPQHHKKYKHPPKREEIKQTKNITMDRKRKQPEKDVKNKTKGLSVSPKRKVQKIHDFFKQNLHNLSQSPTRSDNSENNEAVNKDSDVEREALHNDVTPKQTLIQPWIQHDHSPNRTECKMIENTSMLDVDAPTMILDLFLVEMPEDFFQLYEFCKSISKDLPSYKSIFELVGPYDVLKSKIKWPENEDDKEKFLTQWRYYYDPPEFQTIVKCNDKEGLHFGYWRDDVTEKPVFVAKNRANVNCVFEPVAANIFGAIDAYLQDKAKSANPFEKPGITRLHSYLKKFTKEHNITLERKTIDMIAREKRVVARTFHKVGIVVPYDKKTQLGYRSLAATDSELQKILKQIEEASTPEERKAPLAKLDEVVRLATIAADECDFGTCLELGHDLFSNGSIHVQSRALQMLSVAYTHLQRPQLLKILKAHLKNRKKDCKLSAI